MEFSIKLNLKTLGLLGCLRVVSALYAAYPRRLVEDGLVDLADRAFVCGEWGRRVGEMRG